MVALHRSGPLRVCRWCAHTDTKAGPCYHSDATKDVDHDDHTSAGNRHNHNCSDNNHDNNDEGNSYHSRASCNSSAGTTNKY